MSKEAACYVIKLVDGRHFFARGDFSAMTEVLAHSTKRRSIFHSPSQIVHSITAIDEDAKMIGQPFTF